MKKLFTIASAILFIVGILAGPAAACYGPYCGSAQFSISTHPDPDPLFGYDYTILPGFTGAAGGLSGAIAGSQGNGFGFVCNGEAGGDIITTAGNIMTVPGTGAHWVFNPVPEAELSIGVVSSHYASATTSAKVDVYAGGNGFAMANAKGYAAEGTLDGSFVVGSFIPGWKTEGFSGGIAGQGAIGGFSGQAVTMSHGDEFVQATGIRKNGKEGYVWLKLNGKHAGETFVKPFNWHPDEPSEWEAVMVPANQANAGFEAGITMSGGSYAQSYRFMDNTEFYHTEGMGTYVGANTEVTSYGSSYGDDDGCAFGRANVHGGFHVIGGAGSITTQELPGVGSAHASAIGFYSGGGSLNTNYTGSVNGYTATSISTPTTAGLVGSVITSSAGMSVSSYTSGGNLPN